MSLSKKNTVMKYLVCSDIHLGHKRTPTSHIINSFKNSILTTKNSDIKVLFIAGDLFDRLLDLNSKEVREIIGFIHYLLDYCHANQIKLRVLEGTPSHDFQQSELLVKLNDIRDNKVDLRYFKTLDIEYLAEYNKYVLYLPDEWTNTQQDLENQITEKLNNLGITQVDIGILHGQFTYQVKGNFPGLFFSETYFLNLVKGFIHVGHYHTYSYFDRIIANGSLERLAHNEEEPKGYVVIDGKAYSFIHNNDAYIYKTIKVTAATTVDKLDKQIRKYPPNSFIQLQLPEDHPFNITFQELRVRYMDYNLKRKRKSSTEETATVAYILTDDQLDTSNKFIIDTDVAKAVISNIDAKHDLSLRELSKLTKYLEVFSDLEAPSTI